MTVSSSALRKLAALNLSAEQMAGVLEILADTSEADEARRAAQRERTRRHREKRDCNVTETSLSCDGNAPPEVSPAPLPNPKENPPKGGQKKRATRIPDDFEPDTDWAVTQGLTLSQAQAEAAKFRDYWASKGANATKTDWQATWRNWVRSALERLPTSRASPAKPRNALDAATDLLRRMKHANPQPDESDGADYPLALGFAAGR